MFRVSLKVIIAVVIAAVTVILNLLRLKRPSRSGEFLASEPLEQAKEGADGVFAGEALPQPIEAMREAARTVEVMEQPPVYVPAWETTLRALEADDE